MASPTHADELKSSVEASFPSEAEVIAEAEKYYRLHLDYPSLLDQGTEGERSRDKNCFLLFIAYVCISYGTVLAW